MKPQPILLDMPHHIKQSIINHSDVITKFRLRQCSKDFKALTERNRVHFGFLNIFIGESSIRINIFHSECQRNMTWHSKDAKLPNFHFKHRIETEDFMGGAVDWLMNTLRTNMIFLDSFDLHFMAGKGRNQEFLMKLTNSLAEFGQVHAKSLTINDRGNGVISLDPIISYLQPKILENIEVHVLPEFSLDSLTQTDQWKHAKHLRLCGTTRLPYQNWQHFETTHMHMQHLTLEMVKEDVENFLRNPNARKWEVEFETSDERAIEGYLMQKKINSKEEKSLKICADYGCFQIKRI